jgi:hypothetical protein
MSAPGECSQMSHFLLTLSAGTAGIKQAWTKKDNRIRVNPQSDRLPCSSSTSLTLEPLNSLPEKAVEYLSASCSIL